MMSHAKPRKMFCKPLSSVGGSLNLYSRSFLPRFSRSLTRRTPNAPAGSWWLSACGTRLMSAPHARQNLASSRLFTPQRGQNMLASFARLRPRGFGSNVFRLALDGDAEVARRRLGDARGPRDHLARVARRERARVSRRLQVRGLGRVRRRRGPQPVFADVDERADALAE